MKKLHLIVVLITGIGFVSDAASQISISSPSSSDQEESSQVHGHPPPSLLPVSRVGHVTMENQEQRVDLRDRPQPQKFIYYDRNRFPNGFSKLVLRWIPSACKAIPCGQMRNSFVVHSFWREVDHTSQQWPYSVFPENLVELLGRRMAEDWPDLTKRRGDYLAMKLFWKNMYHSHGMYFSSFTPVGYFKRVLSLAKVFSKSLQQQLQENNIRPLDLKAKYEPSKIEEAIKAFTDHIPEIHCVTDKDGRLYFSEVRLCVDEDGFLLLDCPPRRSTCNRDDGVYYALPFPID